MSQIELLARLFDGEDVPELEERTYLRCYDRLTITQARMLVGCPYVSNIEKLNLEGNGLSIKALELIANAKYLAKLECLLAGSNRVRPNGAVAIAEGEYVKNLRELSLRKSEVGAKGCRALAESANLPSLQVLNLSRTELGGEGGEALGGWKHSELEELYLRVTQIGDQGARALAKAKGLKSLRVLDLHKCKIRSDGVQALAESPYLSNLEELDLSSNKIGRQGLEALANSESLIGLRKLNLHHTYLEGDDIAALAGSAMMERLEEIDIETNEMSLSAYAKFALDPVLSKIDADKWPEVKYSDEEILELLDLEADEELFEALCEVGFNALNADIAWTNGDVRKAVRRPWAKEADEIRWRGHRLSKTAARAIAGAHRLTGLKRLDLEDNRLGVDSMEALADSEYLRAVEALNLSKNPIGDEGFACLVGSPLLRDLREFEASATEMSEEGAKAIFDQADSFLNLRVLKLADNDFKPTICQRLIDASGSSAMHRFVEAGDGWHSLEVLDLSGNYLTNDGVRKLFDSWILHSVRELSLRDTNIGDRALVRLLHSVVLMPNLTRLDLSENRITDDGARMLSQCPKLSTVEYLDLRGNRISADGIFSLSGSQFIDSSQIKIRNRFGLL